MLEVLGIVNLRLGHLLDPAHLHGLLLLELLLLLEGSLSLTLLLKLLSLLGSHLLLLGLKLLLLLKHLLLLEGELLLGLLLDELVSSRVGVDTTNGGIINNPTGSLLLPLSEQSTSYQNIHDQSSLHGRFI